MVIVRVGTLEQIVALALSSSKSRQSVHHFSIIPIKVPHYIIVFHSYLFNQPPILIEWVSDKYPMIPICIANSMIQITCSSRFTTIHTCATKLIQPVSRLQYYIPAIIIHSISHLVGCIEHSSIHRVPQARIRPGLMHVTKKCACLDVLRSAIPRRNQSTQFEGCIFTDYIPPSVSSDISRVLAQAQLIELSNAARSNPISPSGLETNQLHIILSAILFSRTFASSLNYLRRQQHHIQDRFLSFLGFDTSDPILFVAGLFFLNFGILPFRSSILHIIGAQGRFTTYFAEQARLAADFIGSNSSTSSETPAKRGRPKMKPAGALVYQFSLCDLMVMLKVGLSNSVQRSSSISQFGLSIYSDSIAPAHQVQHHPSSSLFTKKPKKKSQTTRPESDDSETRECVQLAISHTITKQFDRERGDVWSKLHESVFLINSNSHDVHTILKDRESLMQLYQFTQSTISSRENAPILPPLTESIALVAIQCSLNIIQDMEHAFDLADRKAVCYFVSDSHLLCHYQLLQLYQFRLKIKERSKCQIFTFFISDFNIISFSQLCSQSFLTPSKDPIYIFPPTQVIRLPLSVSHSTQQTAVDIYACFSNPSIGSSTNLTSNQKQHIVKLFELTKDSLAKLFLSQLKKV